MRKSKLPWFLAGLLITLLAFFGSHAGDLSMIERLVSPEYVDAHRALRKLETQMALEPGESGFDELAALFLDRYRESNPERDMAGVTVTRIERQTAVISVDEKDAPEVVPVTSLLSNGQKIEWNHAELMDAIAQYKGHTVMIAALIVFAIGALIQLIAFALERRTANAPTVVVDSGTAS